MFGGLVSVCIIYELNYFIETETIRPDILG